jgi:MoaA/NifB/PqqE/SkfB family radical SAM enzyme
MRQLINNLLVPVVMRLLIWQAEKRKRPFIGSINVVNRCNLHCAGC